MYNESLRLAGTLPRFVDFVQQSSVVTELVLVDDGSDDDTAEQAGTLVPPHVGRVLKLPHRGKGGAVSPMCLFPPSPIRDLLNLKTCSGKY